MQRKETKLNHKKYSKPLQTEMQHKKMYISLT